MFYFFKKYWKYFLLILVIIFMFTISFFIKDDNLVVTERENKLSISNDDNNKNSINNNTVFVDIKGAVNSPGVYEIENEKRIIDVVTLAGGLTSDAYTKNLNLSKKVEDEMYLIIYTKQEIEDYIKKNNDSNISSKCVSTECVCPDISNKACNSNENTKNSTTKKDSSKTENTKSNNTTITTKNGKISINTATKEELMTLNGIGEVKAQRIIDYRNDNGLFEKIEDIVNVSGISENIFNKIKDNITI